MGNPAPYRDLDQPIWGVPAMVPVLNTTEKALRYKIRAGHIKVGKVGGRFVATPRQLLAQLPSPPVRP
jgi:hypothetical protein